MNYNWSTKKKNVYSEENHLAYLAVQQLKLQLYYELRTDCKNRREIKEMKRQSFISGLLYRKLNGDVWWT